MTTERRELPSVAQLRAILAVADSGSFRAAATALGVTQPAVSAAVHALEELLGASLIDRQVRRLTLTDVGIEVVERARTAMSAVEDLLDAADLAGHPFTGTVRLGVIPTVAPYLLPVVLRAMRRDFPAWAPEVTEDQTAHLLDRLATRRLDVALLAQTEAVAAAGSAGVALTEIPLYDEEFVVVVPAGHPLAQRSQVSLSVLRELPLLLLEEGHCLRDQALDVCRQAGGPVDHPARAASLATITQLVAAGLGATLLPATAVPVETRRGALATVPFRPPAPGRTIVAVHRASTGRARDYAVLAERIRRAVSRSRLPASVLGEDVEPVSRAGRDSTDR